MQFIKNTAIFTIALFFLRPATVVAQGKSFEERKALAVANLKNFPLQDTARINALVEVFKTAIYLKQRQEVIPYCDEALAISRQLNYAEGLANCFYSKAQLHKSSSDYPHAQIYFDSVIMIAGSIPDKPFPELNALANRWKGTIYYDQENYYTALNYFFESLKYFEYNIGFSTGQLYTSISNIYRWLNNFEKAKEYANKTIVFAEKGPDKMMLAQAYLSFVDLCMEKNELNLAEVYLEKISPYIPDSIQLMINFGYYLRRGELSYHQQKYDIASNHFENAYKYAAASDHDFNKSTALSYLSNTALKTGNWKSAKNYALQNLALDIHKNTKIRKADALKDLSEYYNKTGNNGKAYDLLHQAMRLKDSVVSETNIKQVNTLAAIYETDKKQKEIIRLQSEKKIQEVAVKQQSILNKVFIATIAGLVFFGYLAYRNFKNGQKITTQQQEIQQQHIIELEKDKQLHTVEAMLRGQEEERNRIAKDLHDGLGGMLSGVKLSFINMKENMAIAGGNLNSFERSITMLDNTISELRKVAHNLMPEVLVRFGLDEALKDFCNSIALSTTINVIYQQFGEDRKLSSQAEITVYRIVLELVNNALKYAAAKQIIVQLTKNHTKIGITVEDDGKGFEVELLEDKKGAGFINIKYRVDYFKGTLDIFSEPGKGTSVNIELKA